MFFLKFLKEFVQKFILESRSGTHPEISPKLSRFLLKFHQSFFRNSSFRPILQSNDSSSTTTPTFLKKIPHCARGRTKTCHICSGARWLQQRAVFTRRDGGHHKHLSHYCAVVVVVTFACEIRMQNSAVSAPPSSSMKMKMMMMMMMPENEKEENGNVNYCILASSSSRYNPFAVFFYSCIFLPRGMG